MGLLKRGRTGVMSVIIVSVIIIDIRLPGVTVTYCTYLTFIPLQ